MGEYFRKQKQKIMQVAYLIFGIANIFCCCDLTIAANPFDICKFSFSERSDF